MWVRSIGPFDERFLGDPVQPHLNPVDESAHGHLDDSMVPADDIRGCPDALEGIAELPPAGADIVRFIAHPYQVIK